MSNELLSSKVIVTEEPPQVRGIPSFSTSVAGAVGITERGPVGEAVLCISFADFVRKFGGYTPDSDLALAATGFFENGGKQLWVVRTAHYERPLEASSVTARAARASLSENQVPTPAVLTSTRRAPFSLDGPATLRLFVNDGPGQDVPFDGSSAAVLLVGAGPFELEAGMTLELRTEDGPTTVTLGEDNFADIEAATLSEVAQVIRAALPGANVREAADGLRVESSVRGRASTLDVLGGTATSVLTFQNAGVGSGTVADLASVQAAELIALLAEAGVEVDALLLPDGTPELRTRRTGSTASLRLEGDVDAFGFDVEVHRGTDAGDNPVLVVMAKDPGAYGNRLSVRAQPAATNSRFELRVFDGGALRETWPDLSLDATSVRYAPSVLHAAVTGSSLVRVTVTPGATTVPAARATMTGGDDGLANLADTDFLGNASAKSGLNALDRVQDLSIVLIPGQATPGVHQGLVRYCEVDRAGLCFAVLDPPERISATGIVDYVDQSAALGGLTEHAAIYWPRVQVLNPDRNVFGSDLRLVVPPSGIIAGVYARTDGTRPGGVYDPPAGTEKGRLLGVLGFESDEVLEETSRDVVYPRRINPLTTQPGLPRFIDGSRTLKGDGNFPYVAERRGVAFISRSLKAGLQFARHRVNDERLRKEVHRTITAFLVDQMNQGAFRTRDPATAFFVEVSDDPNDIFRGKLVVRIGLATQRPAEWVILVLSQDTRALEAAA
jgi:phage tail sheath protein FI